MTELLERDQFLDQLDSALSLVAAGSGRTVLVGGEAGIGKTSLVEQFTERHRSDTRVLWGGCEALFTPRPLGPLHDIAAQAHPDLLKLLESDAPRAKIFATVLSDLRPGQRPTVVVLEDVHWADEATLDLIKFLGRRITRTGALLVLTYRDDEVGLRHPLRSVMGELPAASLTRLTLIPLSETAVETLARRANRPAAGIHAITGGNPFFVTEILASDRRGVPPTVRDAVLARASRLSAAARRALDAAAVIGYRVDSWLLDATAGSEPQSVDELITYGMLRQHGGDLIFRHELLRQTILEALSQSNSRALHQTVLKALLASPARRDEPARIAYHAEAAGDADAVLEFAPSAARRAAALGAHREAAAQFSRALQFGHSLTPLRRAALLEDFAGEFMLIDQLDDAIHALREANRIFVADGERVKEGVNLTHQARVLIRAGRNAEAEEASRRGIEVLESLPPSGHLAFAYVVKSYLRMLDRDTAEAIAWGEKAITAAERFGHQEAIVNAYNSIGAALVVSGDVEKGRESLEKSLHLATVAGLDTHVALAYVNLGSAFGERYLFQDAEQYLQTGIAYASDRDLDQNLLYMLAWRALVHLYRGRWSEAGEDASAVLRRPGASAISRIMALVAVGRLRARRGDPDVKSALDEALELAAQTGTLQRLAPVRAARAEAAWLTGNYDDAREEAKAAFDLAMRHKHDWFVGELAYWRWRAGELSTPPDVAAEPFRLQIQGEWRAAADAWERIGCPYERARALADGDEEAQRTALAIFKELGARPAADFVRRRLRAQGVRDIPRGPRAVTRSNPAGLSARELEVLSLLGEGLQNTEIASRLFLSAKTIDHHVSAILAKLSARSRAEAVAAAYRSGIINRS
jgi:ATP/maltotriose-dependent transcriptional regulator MalT